MTSGVMVFIFAFFYYPFALNSVIIEKDKKALLISMVKLRYVVALNLN